ncbi:MAG: hypothetical protein HRT44_06305, partial [Bdellovibrionales bacterium]|nr:hypothetical protein [Bdellovibrionales bacterium]
MGPGSHSKIEKEVLGSKYPEVDFWDQPHISNQENSFEILVDSVINRVTELAQNCPGGKVDLISHSFGGLLAVNALRKVPEKVNSLTLISTGYDFKAG